MTIDSQDEVAAKLLQSYHDRIEENITYENDNDWIADLLTEIKDDNELSDNDKEALIIALAEAAEKSEGGVQQNSAKSRPQNEFPKLDFDDVEENFIPCGLDSYRREEYETYAQWLVEAYLPAFHPMPNQFLQHKVVACLMLLNHMACRGDQAIPIVWIQGQSGSGKSELLKAFAAHYPKGLAVQARPDDTASSLRDRLDAAFSGNTQPGLMWYDNWNHSTSLPRFSNVRGLLLANKRNDAIAHLSTKGDNNQSNFKCASYRAFSSVDSGISTSNTMFSEFLRRLWVLLCAKSPADKRLNYSWQGMVDEYKKLWGFEAVDAVKTRYGRYYREACKLPCPDGFSPEVWEILSVPVAVWQYVGLGTQKEAVSAFLTHYEWVRRQDSVETDTYTQYIRAYLKDLQKQAEADEEEDMIPQSAKFTMDRVDPVLLKAYIEKHHNYRVSEGRFEQIKTIMQSFGYAYKLHYGSYAFVRGS
ncbi:hypothetical protein JYQ62_16125 [Nostoc sp. UHCC 0702]|nr:hypothetical protein JYQ62_16125 [Nostoc sp. UHCC 0702]